MIEISEHGDVKRIRMWTRRSAAVGYDVSAYLVRNTLIDTGFRHVWRELQRALEAARPRGIVVTHWHEDHAGNAPVLAAQYPTWMDPFTEHRLRERRQVKIYRHFTWGRPPALLTPLEPFDPSPLQLVATPGHSPDHHVVFDPETGTLFSGDLWLGTRVRIAGKSENPYLIVDSLERAIQLRPRRMFDAHRGLVDDAVAALSAKRDWLRATIAEVERRLDAGESETVILRKLLGGEETTAFVSQGEYSRRNFIRAIAGHRTA